MGAMQRITSDRTLPGVFALVLCLALTGAPGARAVPDEADAERLRIQDGRVFGVLDRQPLAQVLESFARATDMDYDLSAGLGEERISGRYEGLPVGEALGHLLRRFDHMAIWRVDGTIAKLQVTGRRASYRDLGGTVAAETSAEPAHETEPAGVSATEPEADLEELSEESVTPPGLTAEELLEEARFMDLEELAEQAGLSVEDLYFEPSGDQLEPQLNPNILGTLLANAAAPPVSREMPPMEVTEEGLEAAPSEPWEEDAAPRGMTAEELYEAAQFMDLEKLAEQAGLSLEDFYDEPSGDQLEPQLNLNMLSSALSNKENE